MEKAFLLCKYAGVIGQIVPNVWLTNTYSSTTRAFVLSHAENLCITVPAPNVFQGLTVDTIVCTLQKTDQASDSFQLRAMRNGSIVELATYETAKYGDGQRPISTTINPKSGDLVERIKHRHPELGQLAEITRGIHSYRIGGYGQTAFGSGPQTQRDVDERPYHSTSGGKAYRPFIYGRDLRSFAPPQPTEYVKYGPWLAEPRRPEFFEGARVYSRKILADRLIVTLETTNSIADQQVYITRPTATSVSAPYLVGILGSSLIAFFIRAYYDEATQVFPQIKVTQLKSLPIRAIKFSDPTDKARHDRMVELVELMLPLHKQLTAAKTPDDKTRLQRQIEATDHRIDQLVYELYGLTEDDIKIVEKATCRIQK